MLDPQSSGQILLVTVKEKVPSPGTIPELSKPSQRDLISMRQGLQWI